MNNLLEEDETESEKIDDVSDDKKENRAAHLSSEAEKSLNGTLAAKDPPQNLIINCVNGLKTETCI